MITLLTKLGDYFFYWVEIWYRILARAGLFCLIPALCLGQPGSSSLTNLIPVASGLTVPWDLEWMADDEILFSEINGRISKVNLGTRAVVPLFQFDNVARELQSGLLGIARHPAFPAKPFIYAACTFYEGDALVLKLVELEYLAQNPALRFSKTLVENLPAAPTNIGGRLLTTSDGKIFLSVGDNELAETAQNPASLNGKILRYNLDGSIPTDNPFPNSPVWATGVRNSQGLALAKNNLFFTEHGTMSDDELNLLRPGANYGWQPIAGHCDNEPDTLCNRIGQTDPLLTWTPTIAPAGLAFYDHGRYPALRNSLLMANLFDQSLYAIFLNNDLASVREQRPLFSEAIGRLRDVLVSPEGRVFVASSNADIYGGASAGSDAIYEWVPAENFDFSFSQNFATMAPTPADDTLQLDSTLLEIRILTKNLTHPWDMTWGHDNRIWFTENGGWVKRLDPATGRLDTMLHLQDCHFSWGNPGVYSLAFHPDFRQQPYLFLHYTNSPTNSKLTRWRYDFQQDRLTDSLSILPNITANESHNGSRIVFSNNNEMFFALGEAYTPELAQDLGSLNGKILRLRPDGSIPDDNPIPGSPIWSIGHRNPQGLALLPNGILWSSEHGANNDDELNIITKGGNYGWPKVQGHCDLRSEMGFCADKQVIEPIIAWTPTVAPCALEFYDHPAIPEWRNALMQVFLKKGKGKTGQRMTVFQLNPSGNKIVRQTDFFVGKYGRLRDVLVAPDGRVFLCTSNKEISGNGKKVAVPDDDKIIELRPVKQRDQ